MQVCATIDHVKRKLPKWTCFIYRTQDQGENESKQSLNLLANSSISFSPHDHRSSDYINFLVPAMLSLQPSLTFQPLIPHPHLHFCPETLIQSPLRNPHALPIIQTLRFLQFRLNVYENHPGIYLRSPSQVNPTQHSSPTLILPLFQSEKSLSCVSVDATWLQRQDSD